MRASRAGGAAAPAITAGRLERLENQFGGYVVNVPRQVVSSHDPRSKAAIARGGMPGGGEVCLVGGANVRA